MFTLSIRRTALATAVFLLAAGAATATDIYVPDDRPTIQQAIDAAIVGDSVIVRDGTYTGDGNRDIDLRGKAITVRSDRGADACIINPQGSEAVPHRAFFIHQGEGAATILDGFTITGGHAPFGWNGATPIFAGGAIFCSYSAPTIRNCVITQNWAARTSPPEFPVRRAEGGGIALYGSSALVSDCAIIRNTVSNYRSASAELSGGGGIVAVGGSPVIQNCRIAENRYLSTSTGSIVMAYGAGLSLQNSMATVRNCDIVGNRIEGTFFFGFGGGICSAFSADVRILDCFVIGNSASSALGAGAIVDGRTFLRGCLIEGNQGNGLFTQTDLQSQVANCVMTGNLGSGLRALSQTQTVNCLVAGNTAAEGAGVYLDMSNNAGLRNVTVVHNIASSSGGGVFAPSGPTGHLISNSIIWGNAPNGLSGDISTAYCDVSEDPRFGPAASGVWTLAGSYDPATYQVILTDASAAWPPGLWVGAVVNPDLMQGRRFLVRANSSNSLTIWADFQTIASSTSWVQSARSYEIRHYRLSAESPCVDAGSNPLVAPDLSDLDGDSVTSELLPIDLAGQLRFFDHPPSGGLGVPLPPEYPDIVDMGAFERFLDCNGNLVPDAEDIAQGISEDCNANSIPDECDTALGPVVVTPPQSEARCVGSSVIFNVTATGALPLTYQWEKNGIPITGENAASLVLSPVNSSNAGTYSVRVTNSCGTVLSEPATLSVYATGSADIDLNGIVDGLDVQRFVRALIDGPPPLQPWCAADMDADGDIDTTDMSLFMDILLGV